MILALLCAALAGCTPPGMVMAGKSYDYGLAKREQIVKGVSTKADIEKLFGDPYQTTKTGAAETWEYYSREAGRDGAYADRTLADRFQRPRGGRRLQIPVEGNEVADQHLGDA